METTSESRYRPLFLHGVYNVNLDEKSRLMIPAGFRREIMEVINDKTLLIHVGRAGVAKIYPESNYKEMIRGKRRNLLTRKQEDDFVEAHLGMTFTMEWDAQGRVVLPELVMEWAKLGRELVVIGGGDWLILRTREDWKARSAYLREHMDEITDQELDNRDKQTETKMVETPPA